MLVVIYSVTVLLREEGGALRSKPGALMPATFQGQSLTALDITLLTSTVILRELLQRGCKPADSQRL